MKYYSLYLGQAYGQGAYNTNDYSCATTQQSTNTCTTTNSSLVNTGIVVASFVTLACLIIFISLIVRFWRRKSKTPNVVLVDKTEQKTIHPDQNLPK
jgi:hypothetical protein